MEIAILNEYKELETVNPGDRAESFVERVENHRIQVDSRYELYHRCF